MDGQGRPCPNAGRPPQKSWSAGDDGRRTRQPAVEIRRLAVADGVLAPLLAQPRVLRLPQLVQDDRVEAFSLGDRVRLDREAVEQVLWTLYIVAEDIRQCSIGFGNELGIPDEQPSADTQGNHDAGA